MGSGSTPYSFTHLFSSRNIDKACTGEQNGSPLASWSLHVMAVRTQKAGRGEGGCSPLQRAGGGGQAGPACHVLTGLGPWPPQHSRSPLTYLPSPAAGRLWRVPDSEERLLPVPLGVPAGEPPALLPGLPAERKCPSPRAALFTRGPGVSRILGPHSFAGVRLSPSSDLPGPVDGLWLSGDWDPRLLPEQFPGQARAMGQSPGSAGVAFLSPLPSSPAAWRGCGLLALGALYGPSVVVRGGGPPE